MSAPHFLVDALPPGDEYTLGGPEGHHAATVARLRIGESLVLCDGRGGTASAVVTSAGRGSLDLRMGERGYQQLADPRLVVVQAIAKGERGELAVAAMTEVGVDVIVPWLASRCVARWVGDRGAHSHRRWMDAARAAAKQARRAWLPEVPPAEPTRTVAGRLARAACALVLDDQASTPLGSVGLPGTGETVVVVGPEGGIAPDELAAFTAAGAVPVRLGPTVLRTSTAGPAALAILSVRLARWRAGRPAACGRCRGCHLVSAPR